MTKNTHKKIVLSLLWIIALGALAQERSLSVLDPSGYVNKYNVAFDGVGPRVYVLPAPRTKQEIIRDSYEEKGFFRDTISHALSFQTLVSDFKKTSNANLLEELYAPFPAQNEDWHHLINAAEGQGNYMIAGGLLNAYAWQSLQHENIVQAIGLLIGALDALEKTDRQDDIIAIRHNLGNVYLFNRNFKEAAQQQEFLLRLAGQSKSTVRQADAYVKLAMIQAHLRDYSLAENAIIRSAIPIYNRAKDFKGKILALQCLATIYQMQNKHTQAQWFLLQARDLATARNFPNELATIEFMLASSKMIQQNYKVALKEFESARKLAKKDNNELLELAILDKLGDLHLILANYEEAEFELASYWELRNRLFSHI